MSRDDLWCRTGATWGKVRLTKAMMNWRWLFHLLLIRRLHSWPGLT